MLCNFDITSFSDQLIAIELNEGSSTFLVGANGSGKTRLAVRAEEQLGEKAHRISAHRSLSLNPAVAKISQQSALDGLRYGFTNNPDLQKAEGRVVGRWGGKAETVLLNDFDFLIQALFADQSNIALQTHNAVHSGNNSKPELTRFQKLIIIWKRILPHRDLQVTGDDISVNADGQPSYNASAMSDGERAVFYMLGQVLLAKAASVLIFDEPELHVHRAILGRLWDEIEAARPDCAFVVITHDLEFAASRPGQKYVIRGYQAPGKWEIESVPVETGFSEEISTLILGSRKPILFVEGAPSSLDLAIYRACYPDWTVIPRGACENVIHAVVTMRHNASLTRVTCSGIVDADDYSDEEKQQLAHLGVKVLPVSEIENLFLLPEVASAVLEEEKFGSEEIKQKLDNLLGAVLAEVTSARATERVVMRYCRRRIDRTLKKIDLKDAATMSDLAAFYKDRTAALDVEAIATEARKRIETAIQNRDLPMLMANFDDKGLLALASHHLKGSSKRDFESWVTRALRDPNATKLRAAVAAVLPDVTAH